jgi:manganese/iron transport system permease protein/iron/zinc/copper transport system permease protein
VILSTILGALFGAVGIFLSYHLDVASGAAIVLLSAIVFAVVYAVTTLRRRPRLGVPMVKSGLAPPAISRDGRLFDFE